jgi:glycosyltransferase involved in cell wall biosynthesis
LSLGRRSERGTLRHFVYLSEAAVLARWLRLSGADHLHAHFGGHTTTVALLCRLLGGPPFSFTIHGVDEYDTIEEKVSEAAFVLAVSSFGKAQLYRRVNLRDWPKIHEVHCGVDDDLLKAPLTPVPEAPRLVCVARLSVEKGHLILLEAAARLVAEGLHFEIVLVGDGPLRPTVEEQVRRLGLSNQVRFRGWMSAGQVHEAILASRALVLPSFSEGMPVVIMEALALGRPVISSMLSGIPELVVPGRSGWLVPAGSVEALSTAMKDALDAPPSRLEAMGRAGAASVSERHDATREARRLLALLRASAGEGDPRPAVVSAERASAAAPAPGGRGAAPRKMAVR